MKLLRAHVISAETCGGLLDGLDVILKDPLMDDSSFDPLCFIGPNGAGKSQFLQILAEIFQSLFHACVAEEERVEGNPDLQFEIEYLIRPNRKGQYVHVRAVRKAGGKHRLALVIEKKGKNGDWIICDLHAAETRKLLPQKVVGYTSGENETLSLPFLVSRSGYADEVAKTALDSKKRHQSVPDTRLMLIDYGTHLEVLVSNLL